MNAERPGYRGRGATRPEEQNVSPAHTITPNIMAASTVAGNGAPSIDALRRARIALREAVQDGAEHLREFHDLVEDELVRALAERRRGEA
jgi:hypothetical protein